jgi:hypothetical protein
MTMFLRMEDVIITGVDRTNRSKDSDSDSSDRREPGYELRKWSVFVSASTSEAKNNEQQRTVNGRNEKY